MTIDLTGLKSQRDEAIQAESRKVIDNIPELLRRAVEQGQSWAIIATTFGIPGMGRIFFDGKVEHLTGSLKLIWEYLQREGLNPRLASVETEGTVDGSTSVKGRTYFVIAQWHDDERDKEFASPRSKIVTIGCGCCRRNLEVELPIDFPPQLFTKKQLNIACPRCGRWGKSTQVHLRDRNIRDRRFLERIETVLQWDHLRAYCEECAKTHVEPELFQFTFTGRCHSCEASLL